MLQFDGELMNHLASYYYHFAKIIPLYRLPLSITNKQLTNAITRSLEANKDLLPIIFQYA